MRSWPLLICSALWPRYSCGERKKKKRKKQPLFSTSETSVGTSRKFSSTYTGDRFQQAKLNIECLKERWEMGKVITSTTKKKKNNKINLKQKTKKQKKNRHAHSILCLELQESSRTLACTHYQAVCAECFNPQNNNLSFFFSGGQSSKSKIGPYQGS